MWNTNIFFFFTLLKVVSKILCHVFIVMLQLHNYKFEGKNNNHTHSSGRNPLILISYERTKGSLLKYLKLIVS